MTGDRQHVPVDPADVEVDDVMVTDHGTYHRVIGVDGRSVFYEGGFRLVYPEGQTVTVLR